MKHRNHVRDTWREIEDGFVEAWEWLVDGLATIRGKRDPEAGPLELVPVPVDQRPANAGLNLPKRPPSART